MTLNLRIRTGKSAIHFSDGRLTQRDSRQILSNDCQKMLYGENYILTTSGTLDRIDRKFDVFKRLNTDLQYVDSWEGFKTAVTDLVLNEYSKDRSDHEKKCEIFVAYKDGNGNLYHETICVKASGQNDEVVVLPIPEEIQNSSSLISTIEELKIDDLMPNGFIEALNEHKSKDEPDYYLDHNHLYANAMPLEAKRVIPVLLAASYFAIKNSLPTGNTLDLLTEDDIGRIGRLFYEKFDQYKGDQDVTIGFFKDGRKLS